MQEPFDSAVEDMNLSIIEETVLYLTIFITLLVGVAVMAGQKASEVVTNA